MKGCLLSILLAALLLFSVQVFSQLHIPLDTTFQEPARHGDLIRLPLRLYRGYLVVVEGSIGPLENLNFLIDTGAYPSVVDEKIAHTLGLEQRVANVSLSNQSLRAKLVVLPSLGIGPTRIEPLPVLMQDLSFLEKALGDKVDAIVGMDVLAKTSFTIDYKKKQVRFGPIENARLSVPFASTPPYVTIRMELQNCPVRLLIDTADPALMLFRTRVPDAMHLQTVGLETGVNLAGPFQRKKVKVSELALGKKTFGPQVAFIVNDQEDRSLDFDGLLGIRGLLFKEIAFDFEHQKFSWK